MTFKGPFQLKWFYDYKNHKLLSLIVLWVFERISYCFTDLSYLKKKKKNPMKSYQPFFATILIEITLKKLWNWIASVMNCSGVYHLVIKIFSFLFKSALDLEQTFMIISKCNVFFVSVLFSYAPSYVMYFQSSVAKMSNSFASWTDLINTFLLLKLMWQYRRDSLWF